MAGRSCPSAMPFFHDEPSPMSLVRDGLADIPHIFGIYSVL